ncbi:hypothetical protein TRVL_08168 [Trypanosoma vivax]|nr:hypothetical protein TRVL_08168 [Trypanosoma vivax]
MPLGGGEYSRSTWHSTLRWCQLLWNVKKGPGKKTRPMTATGSNAPGVRRSVPHTRGRGSTCYRSTRRSSYRAAPRRFRMHPTATARQSRRNGKEFVCQQCHRVLQSKAWLTRHKCEPTSITNSEGSNVAEQPVTAARPICGKECHYRWLLRHMLTKHPGRDEPLRPQPRAKPKRKETRTEARAQAEWSVMLEPAGDGDVDAERPRKRRQLGRRTELDTTYFPLFGSEAD